MNNINALNDAQIKALLEPFDEGIVEYRKSDRQRKVPHHYVRALLSEIFGPLGWSEQTLELTEVPTGDDGLTVNKYVAYRARVRVTIHPNGTPVAYWDGAGAWGQGRDVREKKTYVWDLHSDCMNGALSVAFLRATKNLGNAFGLSLYDADELTEEQVRAPVRVRHFLPYEADDPEEKEYTQDILDPDKAAEESLT